MERFTIVTALLVLIIASIMAESPSQSYGTPSTSSFSSFDSLNTNNFNRNQGAGGYQGFRNSLSSTSSLLGGGNDFPSLGANIQGPKTFRHISLFVAPQEPDDQPRVRTIRTQQGAPDKHVQIIFVKTPSGSSAQQTEVQLPPQPEQKTLVYVLLKQGAKNGNDVKIRGPSPTKPPAPEVYFIKYKDGGNVNGNNNGGSSSFNNFGEGVSGGAVPVRSSGGLSTSYGVP